MRLGVSAARPGEVVNLATGHLTSVREFAEKGASLLNIDKSALNFGAAPVRSDEMFHDAVVIDRLAHRRTGYPRPAWPGHPADARLHQAHGFASTQRADERPRVCRKPARAPVALPSPLANSSSIHRKSSATNDGTELFL